MNLIQIIKDFMGQKMNPAQMITNIVGNQNPMINNLITMANNGQTKEIEKFARNICNERGINFDSEFSNFISNFR